MIKPLLPIMLICSILLMGCAPDNQDYTNRKMQFNMGQFCKPRPQLVLEKKFYNQGVRVNFLGDKIFIDVPFYRMFSKNSSILLKRKAGKILEPIGRFLRCYQKMLVKVIVYNNFSSNKRRNYEISTYQARQIVHYFWSFGINARLISANVANVNWYFNKGNYQRIIIETKRLP